MARVQNQSSTQFPPSSSLPLTPFPTPITFQQSYLATTYNHIENKLQISIQQYKRVYVAIV